MDKTIHLKTNEIADCFYIPVNNHILYKHLVGNNDDGRGIPKHHVNSYKILAEAHGWRIVIDEGDLL
jgi:hypothetical protein